MSDLSRFHIDPLFNTFQNSTSYNCCLVAVEQQWKPVQRFPVEMWIPSHINTIHSLSGISLWMAGCCTSPSVAYWEGEKKHSKWSRQTPSAAFCHLDHHGNNQIHNQQCHQLQLNILQSMCDGKLFIISFHAEKKKHFTNTKTGS